MLKKYINCRIMKEKANYVITYLSNYKLTCSCNFNFDETEFLTFLQVFVIVIRYVN